MKTLILLALVNFVSARPTTELSEEWTSWKRHHNKQYIDDLEELTRYKIWQRNQKLVHEHNANTDKLGYSLTMNRFGDLETVEFTRIFNGYKMYPRSNNTKVFVADPNFKANATVDWRTKGAVTPVKNQRDTCAACWTFSATGALEGQHFLKTGQLISLSEQNLVDCARNGGDDGCNGGFMDSAFNYVKKNGGIDTEKSYPYRAHDEKCRFNVSNIGATCTGHVDLKSYSESDLQQAVQTIGPISVTIDAGEPSFRLYKEGIYYEPKCNPTMLDHGVLVVGFGTENGKDYWLVKNSFGPEWGMEGYIKMARNRNNNCGIASRASYPTV